LRHEEYRKVKKLFEVEFACRVWEELEGKWVVVRVEGGNVAVGLAGKFEEKVKSCIREFNGVRLKLGLK
jgi:hypothetical protein